MDEVIEATATDVPAQQEILNAVIVVRREIDGAVETDVFVNGDVKVTEAATILELGLASWRKKIGL